MSDSSGPSPLRAELARARAAALNLEAERLEVPCPAELPSGPRAQGERPCFVPLTSRVCLAAAKAVGIDPGTTVDVNFEFGPPGHAFVVARYVLDDAAMARVLEALASIPVPAQP